MKGNPMYGIPRGIACQRLPAFRTCALVLGIHAFGFAAPYLTFLNKAGARTETDLAQIAKVTFSTSAITVHAKAGGTLATPINDIQRILFGVRVVDRILSQSVKPQRLQFTGGAVQLRLPKPAQVGFGIFGLDGKRIYDLPAKTMPIGTHAIHLPQPIADQLQSGLYVLKGRIDHEEMRLIFALSK